MMLAAVLYSMPKREAWILGAALFAFVLANSTNHEAYQRLVEPFLLIFLALSAGYAGSTEVDVIPRKTWVEWSRIAGPCVLAIALAGITIQSLLGYGLLQSHG
jgi:hypothetical protein